MIAEKVIPHENYKVEPSGVPRNDICLIKVPSLRESSPPDCIGKCSKHFHPFAPDEQLADNNSTFLPRKKLKINIKKSSELHFNILNFRMLRSCLPTTEFTSSQTWSTLLDSWMGKYSKGFRIIIIKITFNISNIQTRSIYLIPVEAVKFLTNFMMSELIFLDMIIVWIIRFIQKNTSTPIWIFAPEYQIGMEMEKRMVERTRVRETLAVLLYARRNCVWISNIIKNFEILFIFFVGQKVT